MGIISRYINSIFDFVLENFRNLSNFVYELRSVSDLIMETHLKWKRKKTSENSV